MNNKIQTQNFYNYSNNVFVNQSILDVFVLQDLIDTSDADKLKSHFKTNREIENFLIKNRIVTKDTINKAYSIILKLPYIELKSFRIPENLLSIIPEKVARRFQIIPLSVEDGMLKIALSNPADLLVGFKNGLGRVFEEKNLDIELFVTGESDFKEAVKQYRNRDAKLLMNKGTLPVVYLRNQVIAEQYLKKLPKEFITKYRLAVFGQNSKGIFLIACEDPDSPITLKILQFIRTENKVKFEKFATSKEDIDYVISTYDTGKKDSGADVQLGNKDARDLTKDEISTFTSPTKSPEIEKKQQIQKQDVVKKKPAEAQKSKSSIKGLLDSIFESSEPEITIDQVDDEIDKENNQLIDTEKKNEEQIVEAKKTDAPKTESAESKVGNPVPNNQAQDKKTQEPINSFVPEVKTAESESKKVSSEDIEESGDKSNREIGSLIKESITTTEQLAEIAKEENIPKIVAAIVNYALNNRSSDIHVEAENKIMRIRCRIDGILRDSLKLPKKFHPPFVSRIKIMSKLKIDESRVPQDGRFDVVFNDREVDVRVSTLPTVHGEKIVMRVLDKSSKMLSLEDLGMQGSAFQETVDSIAKPYGIILSTGPTGSGKSTTLYAVLNRISTPGVNIVTLEDPVEYEVAGINQCQIKPEIGFTFAAGLRSILRQDPNVIMVGEIRDAETASMATHAALTGHLVLSTLHTNDTAGALPRMINMGVEPFLITSSINLVIAQRLIRRICPKCKEEMKVPEKLLEQLKAEIQAIPESNKHDRERIPQDFKLYYGKGCPECNNGFKGRVGIYEVMTITPEIEELAVQKKPANEIKDEAVKNGMITMRQDGILKAFQGLTTIDEVFQAVIN